MDNSPNKKQINDSTTRPRSLKSRLEKSSYEKQKKHFWLRKPETKLQWALMILIIAFLLVVVIFSIYWFILKEDPKPALIQKESKILEEPKVEPVYSQVSGREIEKEASNKPVFAVQIENSPEARPQSGLIDADIVSEAIAEGGITRFNAIYHDKTPDMLGPVRSLRPYFIDWFMPYDAAIVHAGGSGEALADVQTLRLKDIDHGNSSTVFKRESFRYAPHNLYTTGQQIRDLMTQRNYSSKIQSSLDRKEPKAAPTEKQTAKTINLNVSRSLYNPLFTYDATTNTYPRSQGGMAHVNKDTNQQIAPDVIIVPIMGRRNHVDRVHTVYDTVGSGKLFVFQDGTVVEGTWSKPSRESQWELKDDQGKNIKINAGQRWFTMIESADRVSFSP